MCSRIKTDTIPVISCFYKIIWGHGRSNSVPFKGLQGSRRWNEKINLGFYALLKAQRTLGVSAGTKVREVFPRKWEFFTTFAIRALTSNYNSLPLPRVFPNNWEVEKILFETTFEQPGDNFWATWTQLWDFSTMFGQLWVNIWCFYVDTNCRLLINLFPCLDIPIDGYQ